MAHVIKPSISMLPKCKSSARRRAKAEVRGANPRGSTTHPTPPWQSLAMHSTCIGAHAGQHRPEDPLSKQEAAVAVAQESEFLAVNQKIRVRIPAVTPFHNARDAEIVEAAACKPALTRCESGRALHFGAIVQQQDDATASRRSGCDSPWLHHFIGHEEDSNPRRSDRRTHGAIALSYKRGAVTA